MRVPVHILILAICLVGTTKPGCLRPRAAHPAAVLQTQEQDDSRSAQSPPKVFAGGNCERVAAPHITVRLAPALVRAHKVTFVHFAPPEPSPALPFRPPRTA